MSARGILPDASYGGTIVATLPAPAGVSNAYVPPLSFTVSQPLTFYGFNCAANRFDPQQLNAFESEMLSFAATLAPNGTWNAGSVSNLAAAFQAWASTFTGGVSLAPSSLYPAAIASNTSAATPAFVAAAVAAAGGAVMVRAYASMYPGIAANDLDFTTPAYVQAAVAGAINNALAPSVDFPAVSVSNVLAATPAYVGAALVAEAVTIEAAVSALIPALSPASTYPSAVSSDTTATTPAYVAAALAAVGGVVLDHAASYPDASNDTKAATPAYVAAAVAAIGGGGGASTLAGDTDVSIASPTNAQALLYDSISHKWENTSLQFNMSLSISGLMAASELLLQFVFPRAVLFPIGLSTSFSTANTNASGATSVTIKKNGAAIGSIDWASGVGIATFTFASAILFVTGDILQLVAPTVPDTALADVGISLVGVQV